MVGDSLIDWLKDVKGVEDVETEKCCEVSCKLDECVTSKVMILIAEKFRKWWKIYAQYITQNTLQRSSKNANYILYVLTTLPDQFLYP